MASDGKSYNCKVLRLVEMDDFDIKTVPIRGRMQKLQAKQWAATVFGRIIRAGIWIGRMNDPNIRAIVWVNQQNHKFRAP